MTKRQRRVDVQERVATVAKLYSVPLHLLVAGDERYSLYLEEPRRNENDTVITGSVSGGLSYAEMTSFLHAMQFSYTLPLRAKGVICES